MMMSSAGQATGCATKPLVINHALNSEIKLSSNQTSERSIIPSLSSQLIYSSIITTTKTKSSNTTNSNATLSRQQQVSQPTLSPAKTTLVVGSKRSASTTSSSEVATSPTLEGLNAIVRSSGGCTKLQVPYPTGFIANTTSPIAAGQAVSARLIDMGKKLLEAARAGMVDDVRQLVVNSGAPFTSDWLGTTALHLAAQHGHAEITEILLRGGVNRDARTKLERTALHLAAQGGHLEVVDLLLMHGSDVNARDMLKMTPLHWAVERNHVCVVEKLLFCGADAQAKSKFQLTPIEIAHNSPSYEMLELFKSWTTNKDENLNVYGELDINGTFSHESHDALDVDYHLSIENTATTSRASMLDINEPCIDLVELEWNALKFEPDFFLSNDDEEEPRVEYLMKIVEELQKENRQLRKRVEQLSTACR